VNLEEASVRVEVSLPLYLCQWIDKRDSHYVARRLQAFFLSEKTQ
jgi:hypothetical protein